MAKKKTGGGGIKSVFRTLYIILVALSAVIVVVFVALQIYAPAPTIDSVVTFQPASKPSPTVNPNPTQKPSADPNSSAEPSEPAETDDPVQTDDGTVSLHRKANVYTCLMVGNADLGGTDTILLGVFDTANLKASLISIPRDTCVYAEGHYRKINTLYSIGGIDLLKEKITSSLAVPIDYYVMVNTNAFKEVVDTIGGVYFDVPPGMDYEDPFQNLYIHLAPGYQLLNGTDALKLCRCRSDSAYHGQADIGRVNTQRLFLQAMAKQTLTMSNADKLPKLIEIAAQYVKTDMPVNTIVHFATKAIGMDLDNNLTMDTLPGMWDFVAFYQLNNDDVLNMVNSLGLYEEDVPPGILDIAHVAR